MASENPFAGWKVRKGANGRWALEFPVAAAFYFDTEGDALDMGQRLEWVFDLGRESIARDLRELLSEGKQYG